ncbi:hypothetical protein LCGC14_1902660 [marine sediment metagenome]|uniref:Thioredoxin domain-containing protein n=1 Tax=marine sediment metagenome TaxID=412755 RepID=A0A0F9FWE3_9ZZZZ
MTLTSRTFGWMRDGLGNLRAAREIEAFLSLGQIGRVFWFDPIVGADGNSGERADDAKGTFQGGIDLMVAERGDLLIRMRGYDQPAATVNFNKFGITAIPTVVLLKDGKVVKKFVGLKSKADMKAEIDPALE